MRVFPILLAASALLAATTSAAEQRVTSPDGKLALVVSDDAGLRYRVELDGKPILADSERAHDLSAEQSETGRVANHGWRDAAPNGIFSYVLALPTTPKPVLVCTYWGGDRDRTFDVVVNGVVVATQKLEGRQPGKTFEVAYPLPPESLTGQQNLTVRFQGTGQGRVGGLLGLRLQTGVVK